jgi:hypothetical protein
METQNSWIEDIIGYRNGVLGYRKVTLRTVLATEMRGLGHYRLQRCGILGQYWLHKCRIKDTIGYRSVGFSTFIRCKYAGIMKEIIGDINLDI